ncbi:MAG: non-hydrolyzing UDP-N-acetylglucosamine 2-epimerase [Sporichthyaceae bacterium]
MSALVMHVVGARPNFPKLAPVWRALAQQSRGRVRQMMVHTGQHYDPALSDAFFADLELPAPEVNLAVGSGSHAVQTAAVLTGIEEVLLSTRPALVLVYGDVNSTLGATVAAAKVGVPVGHVEAGLRSFDRSMPEEINRIVVDSLADLLFVTSPEALVYLGASGIPAERVHLVGNPMVDSLFRVVGKVGADRIREELDLPERWGLATLHRPGNVDDAATCRALVQALEEISASLPLLVPVHPRGRAALTEAGLASSKSLRCIEPLGYATFLAVMAGATLVVTDSGGVQEETTALGVPCLTVRPNTERPITCTHGTNRLVAPAGLSAAAAAILATGGAQPAEHPPLWDGQAGPRIARVVLRWLADRSVLPEQSAAGVRSA